MKVLSLFDGISCGRVALERACIPVERYVAYEIDKYAVQISKKNYPDIVHHGDVFEGDFTQYKFDLLIGGSPCFTKGHLVLTDRGYKDISEIRVGDMVLTHENRYKPVVRTYIHAADTVALKVVGYPTFITTSNHPFLTKTRGKDYSNRGNHRKFSDTAWTKVEDMTKDTFCGMHIEETDIEPVDLDDKVLWLLGRYIADGHVRKDKRKGRKDSYLYQLIISVGKDKLTEFKRIMGGYNFSCYPHSQSVYRCVFNSMNLVNFVLAQGFGCHAAEKHIPDAFMHLPDEQAKIFIEGYLSGDGHYTEADESYHASTVSKELAFELQRLIARVYKTNVGVSLAKPRTEKHCIGGREIRSNYPLYTISFKQGLRKQSYAYIAENKCWTGFRNCTPTDKVETVYNIEVADDHSYTVNNCIVHNCTFWSIAKQGREVTPDGMGGKLFMQYVRALHESGCKYFLYENNYSIHKDIKAFISEQLGVEPIMINSALVSAQNRKRCYWTNIPFTSFPEDKGILLKDVLESGVAWQDKSYCMTASYDGAVLYNTLERKQRTMVAEPTPINTYQGTDKSRTVMAGYHKYGEATLIKNKGFKGGATAVAEPVGAAQRGRYEDDKNTSQHIEVRKDGKSNCLTTVQKDSLVCAPVRVGQYGKGGQGQRIYSVIGKSVTLSANGDGQGAKTGLYKIDLPDGDYLVRKLTPIEAERLQTLPDNYTAGISNTQRYKCIGNGWTVDVIAHILSFLKEDQ